MTTGVDRDDEPVRGAGQTERVFEGQVRRSQKARSVMQTTVARGDYCSTRRDRLMTFEAPPSAVHASDAVEVAGRFRGATRVSRSWSRD